MTVDSTAYKSPVIAQAITQLINAGIQAQADSDKHDAPYYDPADYNRTVIDGKVDLEELGRYVAAGLGF